MGPRASVRAYVAAQAASVRAGEARLRAAEPEAVHDTRVAVRRLRSMLGVFPALGEAAPDDLADRLHDWSDRLGDVRDLETLSALLSEVCPETLWDRLRPQLEQETAVATAALMAALDTPAHRDLLEDVAALALADPGPLDAHKAADRAVRKAEKRLRQAGDDPERLHRARRAAKRARYAAEAIGDKAEARRWESVQERLGTHHDCVVALARLAGITGPEAADARGVLRERMHAAWSGSGSGEAG